MNYNFKQTDFSHCLLSGLFAGLAAAVLNIIFFCCFSSSDIGTNYSVIINPFTIFFGGVIPAVVGGLLYYFFSRINGGIFMYIIISFATTILLVEKALQIHSMSSQNAEKLFHEILASMIIIGGLFTTFIIPILIRNKKLEQLLF